MRLKHLIAITMIFSLPPAFARSADAAFNAYMRNNAKNPVLSKKVKIQQAFAPTGRYSTQSSDPAKGDEKDADKKDQQMAGEPGAGDPGSSDPSAGGPAGDSGFDLSPSSSSSSSSSASSGSSPSSSSSFAGSSSGSSGSFGATSAPPSAPVAPVPFDSPAPSAGNGQVGFAPAGSSNRTPSSAGPGGSMAGFDPADAGVPPGVDPEVYRSAYQQVNPNQVVGSALGNWYRERDERRRAEAERRRQEWERRQRELRENGYYFGSDR